MHSSFFGQNKMLSHVLVAYLNKSWMLKISNYDFTDDEPDCGSNLSSLYNSVMEGDFFQLYCNISFRAKWMPKMVCSQNEDNMTRLSDDAWQHSSTTGRQSVALTVAYVADRSKHDSLYACRIFFASYLRVDGFAYENVSYYTKSWISPRVNITCRYS